MADWTVHLEFEEGNSSKFWRARIEDGTLYVNYGKIGTAGQTQVKELGDAGAAKEYEKLIKEKRKKGYVDAGEGGGGGGGGDDDEEEKADDEGDDEDEAPPAKVAKPAPAPVKPAASASAGRPANATRLALSAGNRKVETFVSIDGSTVRMESIETYSSPDAAKKAADRLKKTLVGEGYKE